MLYNNFRGAGSVAYSYTRLWVLLVQRGMTKQDLQTGAQLSSATIARMGKSENVSLGVLNKVCNFMGCRLEDIVEHMPD